MGKTLAAMLPVELTLAALGPFRFEHRRIYYPDGSDWNGQWSVGIAGIGQVAILPAAWILNRLVKAGLIDLRPMSKDEVDALRALSAKMAMDPVWRAQRSRWENDHG